MEDGKHKFNRNYYESLKFLNVLEKFLFLNLK